VFFFSYVKKRNQVNWVCTKHSAVLVLASNKSSGGSTTIYLGKYNTISGELSARRVNSPNLACEFEPSPLQM